MAYLIYGKVSKGPVEFLATTITFAGAIQFAEDYALSPDHDILYLQDEKTNIWQFDMRLPVVPGSNLWVPFKGTV